MKKRYDIFISYSSKDFSWVRNWLLPRLEKHGYLVCIDFRDFDICIPILINIENAVKRSKKTILILTPNWVRSEWTKLESLLIQTLYPIGRKQRIFPLLLKRCKLPERIRIFTYAGFTAPQKRKEQLNRVIEQIGLPTNLKKSKTFQIQPTQPLPPYPSFTHYYPLHVNFTGRATERSMLNKWLTRNDRKTEALFSLVAMGGMGKSSLAWYWLQNDVLERGVEYWKLSGVFWWNFDEVYDFSKFLEWAIVYTSNGTINPQKIYSDADRIHILVNLLQQKRYLIVLDGFEQVLRGFAKTKTQYRNKKSVKPDREIRTCTDPNTVIFLRNFVSNSLSKILLLSRLCPKELERLAGVKEYTLRGIDPVDAVDFFKNEEIRGKNDVIKKVCKKYEYHPLSLRILAGILREVPGYNSDIRNAPNINVYKEEPEQNILRHSYNHLPQDEQHLISKLAAFPNPMKWEDIHDIFIKVFKNREKQLFRAIQDLIERGILQSDKVSIYYLHPLVQEYCYNCLIDKSRTHMLKRINDLQPVINLFNHTIEVRKYDAAWKLFQFRLHDLLYYKFGKYQLIIKLLLVLLNTDNEKPLRIIVDKSNQALILNELANAYSLTGEPLRGISLFKQHNKMRKEQHDRRNLAKGLLNLAYNQGNLGQLKSGQQTLQHIKKICREVNDIHSKAVYCQARARLAAYCGKSKRAENELDVAEDIYKNYKNKIIWEDKSRYPTVYMYNNKNYEQSRSVIFACRAIHALMNGDFKAAKEAASKAYDLTKTTEQTEGPYERNFIRAKWLLGASDQGLGNHEKAEKHLKEALLRDRKSGLVELEAPILLEYAKLRFAQSYKKKTSIIHLMQESYRYATDALKIADRCNYRLQQADIHYFLSEYYTEVFNRELYGQLNISEYRSKDPKKLRNYCLQLAKKHAMNAEKCAYCDGPPYYYKVAFEKANKLLIEISQIEATQEKMKNKFPFKTSIVNQEGNIRG